MSQSPSNKYLTTAYQYKDFLFQCWPEIEKSIPFSMQNIQNDPKHARELFIALLQFNAIHIDKGSLIWSDISWLFSELLEEIFGLQYFEKVDKKECFRLINYFKNNKDVILKRVYGGEEILLSS